MVAAPSLLILRRLRLHTIKKRSAGAGADCKRMQQFAKKLEPIKLGELTLQSARFVQKTTKYTQKTRICGTLRPQPRVSVGVVSFQDRVPPDMYPKKATRTQQFPRLSDNNWSPLREIILQTRPRCAPPGKGIAKR